MKIFNFKSFANYSINRFFYSLIKIILFILFIFSFSKCNIKALSSYDNNLSYIRANGSNGSTFYNPNGFTGYTYLISNNSYPTVYFDFILGGYLNSGKDTIILSVDMCAAGGVFPNYISDNFSNISSIDQIGYRNYGDCVLSGSAGKKRTYYYKISYNLLNNGDFFGHPIFQIYGYNNLGYTTYLNVSNFGIVEYSLNAENTILSLLGTSSTQVKTDEIIKQNEEGEKTRKGIWGSIKDGFSSIGTWFTNLGSSIANGFSSLGSTIGNFFNELGNKIGGFFTTLLNGIIDGLKALFIPKDNFFSSWFSNFKSFFEEKLGFLLYPFTFVIDILNRFLGLSDTGSYVINIPNISIPIFDLPIINATSFDLGSLLSNQNFKIMHDLYFVFIDVLFFLGFMGLCKRQYVSIFGGTSDDLEYVSSGEVTKQSRKSRSSKRSKE